MEMLYEISQTIFVLSILLSIRGRVTEKHSERALYYIFSQENWRELDEKYKPSDNFINNALNLRKWTYKQMVPGL